MNDFILTLEDCLLHDLGFIRPKFTWSNEQLGSSLTKERLDRVVVNFEWCNKWPGVEVIGLVC